MGAQIIQARLGEKGPRLFDVGRAVFTAVDAGTTEAGFRECPEDVSPPTSTSWTTAPEHADNELRSGFEECLRAGKLASQELAASVVARLSSSPSKDEAENSSEAARLANAAEFDRQVADRDDVKNSGVHGSLITGRLVDDRWTPDDCPDNRLIERPGSSGQRVSHTWHVNSFALGQADVGGAYSAPPRVGGILTREDLLDDDQARRGLDKAQLLDRQGLTDGGGKEQTGYCMPSKGLEPKGRAVCKATLVAAVQEGAVRVVVSMNGAGEDEDLGQLAMFPVEEVPHTKGAPVSREEELWGHVDVTDV